jgi:hypothetical protein
MECSFRCRKIEHSGKPGVPRPFILAQMLREVSQQRCACGPGGAAPPYSPAEIIPSLSAMKVSATESPSGAMP